MGNMFIEAVRIMCRTVCIFSEQIISSEDCNISASISYVSMNSWHKNLFPFIHRVQTGWQLMWACCIFVLIVTRPLRAVSDKYVVVNSRMNLKSWSHVEYKIFNVKYSTFFSLANTVAWDNQHISLWRRSVWWVSSSHSCNDLFVDWMSFNKVHNYYQWVQVSSSSSHKCLLTSA